MSDEEEFRLRFLDPAKVVLFRAGDALRVTVEGDRSLLRVIPMRAFPISLRDRYISLRDEDGNELGMIREPDELDVESRKLLVEALSWRYFTPTIREIVSLKEKLGIVEWEVVTDRGSKRFLSRSLLESLKETDAGLMVTDVENNRYEIRRDVELDARSDGILERAS